MMEILFDSKLLLGDLIHWHGCGVGAENTINLLQASWFQGYMSALGLEKLDRVVSKLFNEDVSAEIVVAIASTLSICPVDTSLRQLAYSLHISDFEAAVDVACAIAQNLDAIVTRQPHHFAEVSPPTLRILSADEFVKLHLAHVLQQEISPNMSVGSWLQREGLTAQPASFETLSIQTELPSGLSTVETLPQLAAEQPLLQENKAVYLNVLVISAVCRYLSGCRQDALAGLDREVVNLGSWFKSDLDQWDLNASWLPLTGPALAMEMRDSSFHELDSIALQLRQKNGIDIPANVASARRDIQLAQNLLRLYVVAWPPETQESAEWPFLLVLNPARGSRLSQSLRLIVRDQRETLIDYFLEGGSRHGYLLTQVAGAKNEQLLVEVISENSADKISFLFEMEQV